MVKFSNFNLVFVMFCVRYLDKLKLRKIKIIDISDLVIWYC